MIIFRNPELKRRALLFVLFTALAVTGGAFINIKCAVYVSVICVISGTVQLMSVRKHCEELARLSEKIDLLLHGEDRIDFSSFQEGELAILSDEIDKMAIRLREQNGAMAQDKQYLQESLADISHQLRTPLTSLRLILARLREDDLSADDRMDLAMKTENILSRLGWLIDSLLKISRLESGTVLFERKRVDIAGLIQKSVESFEILLELREVHLNVGIVNDAAFTGDFGWSAEALENIIKNCIEHTPTGGAIQIHAAENPIYTEIMISDNGCGIQAADLPHVFERFYQGKNASYSNFGIGLALAQMIVHRQNGTIKAENNRDHGVRFIIRFYRNEI